MCLTHVLESRLSFFIEEVIIIQYSDRRKQNIMYIISISEWNIDCKEGVWLQGSRDYAGHKCSNWYGWTTQATVGSISTTFNGIGRAQLDFGNCWPGNQGGLVKAFLNGAVIASAPINTPSVTVEFDFEIGSVLKIAEYKGKIIQFNSLDIIQCNEEIGK